MRFLLISIQIVKHRYQVFVSQQRNSYFLTYLLFILISHLFLVLLLLYPPAHQQRLPPGPVVVSLGVWFWAAVKRSGLLCAPKLFRNRGHVNKVTLN